MTSNRKKAAEIIGREYIDAMSGPTPSAWRGQIAEALAAAGVLADDGFRTAYGVWFRSPNGDEGYDWTRDESRTTAHNIVSNMRRAGWEAEIIARHVSEPRFVTRTTSAHAQKDETDA